MYMAAIIDVYSRRILGWSLSNTMTKEWCNEIQISMDGKGRATDNFYIERFWRSLKQEKIYLNLPNGGL